MTATGSESDTDLGASGRPFASVGSPLAGDAMEIDKAVRPLRGGAVACACPDCGAPMAVRLWLMTADCWRCSLCISLSLEEARRIARATDDARHFRAPPAKRPAVAPAPPAAPAPRRAAATILPPPAVAPTTATTSEPAPGDVQLLTTGGLHDLLSWLISAIVHLLLMILLLLLSQHDEPEPTRIVLSVDFNRKRVEGELPNDLPAVEIPDFDLPVKKRPTNQRERDRLAAEADARELRVDPSAESNSLPKLALVRDALASDDPYRRMVAARDPRVRAKVIENEGGTTMTEAAVARALRWLARHQEENGRWSLHAFHRSPLCDGRCGERGRLRSATGATGLALQAFLGAGQTHRTGIYRDAVSHGLQFLLAEQAGDGDLRGSSVENAGMYAHAQAAIVLCDAYQLTGDEALRGPAQRAIDFLCDAQHHAGGWRYRPGQRGDTSVIGWQLMALHSARAGRLRVPVDVFGRAAKYLDQAQVDEYGAVYAYRPHGAPSPAMTAEGLLSRMYLGWGKKRRGLRLGVAVLAREFPPDVEEPNIYYWYYATQVMHHWGGRPWAEWNREMRDALVTMQETRGHEAGSWTPRDHHDRVGGRLYMTALACCTLEVYYRHAPLFRKIDLR